MNPEERDRLAHEFVDKALARYGQAEPRTGLEARILARLADTEAAPGWWQWKWAAMAVAAVLALAMGVGVYRAVHRTTGPQRSAISPTSAPTGGGQNGAPAVSARLPQIAGAPTGPLGKHSPQGTRTTQTRRNTGLAGRARGPQAATADSPRLAQFPAPAPLSDQERLLLSYLKRTPREEIVAVVKENEEFQRRLREAEEMRTPTQ